MNQKGAGTCPRRSASSAVPFLATKHRIRVPYPGRAVRALLKAITRQYPKFVVIGWNQPMLQMGGTDTVGVSAVKNQIFF